MNISIFSFKPAQYIDSEALYPQKPKCDYQRWESGLWEFVLQIFIMPRIYLGL